MIIDFYFDFLSPFSYLANHRLAKLAQEYSFSIRYHSIDLARAKIAIGNVGPSNRDLKVKLDYLTVDLQRWAELYGIPLVFPANYNSRKMNVGVYYPSDLGETAAYVNIVFNAVWGEGMAPDSESLVTLVSGKLAWDRIAFEKFLTSHIAVGRYDEQTEAAIERKVFGVPTIFFGDEMWWGNDRLFMLENALACAFDTESN
ncbi:MULTISPECIES: 2-hydroxychromene-2-carboxylate isomerase [Pseudomonas]|uniref:2-hydroxychromene-2-carboxylate isomerase n=1 Tax=Pseudomonas TaxID=286 RepID=UPI0009D52572|nr:MULTISPECIES: 2-hydroxychromene-2-carboxylate isomerase [unclassified Pseudomonas]OPK04001.1 2-hydroxychromene-2-carboxylate isomerase [Pseudomonas veronii]UHH01024.1 2-hydroxychromene-2-carboxylate isomerase [Pseudomonas sp. 7-41]WLD69463.1 2-hydroxychromene-2-carboxylate isomerase [Pseudomonas sp. OVF7]